MKSASARVFAIVGCASLATAIATPALAQSASPIVAEMTPIQGPNAPLVAGWNEFLIRLTNDGGTPTRGKIVVSSHAPYGSNREFVSTAPFAVGAGATIGVRVPAVVSQFTDVSIRVAAEDGLEIAERRFTPSAPNENVFLLDVDEPSILRGVLNEMPIAPSFMPSVGRAHGTGPELLLGSPRMDPATGDPVLPDRSALYGGTDVVLLRSDVLARVTGAELDALSGFVLSGGTIAIAMTRPEDLRTPTIQAFAGGPVTPSAVNSVTLKELVLAPATAGGGASTKVVPAARNPGDDVAPTLAGFAGGNLHGSPYGSSATYGLGEVHLLAFDPTRLPGVNDPWAQVRVVDLARRAHDRRASIVFTPGAEENDGDVTRIRQELDPNENSRWGIAAAALLLCIYAVIAGPISFSAASKKGRPLRALRWLPIFAVLAFLAVVGIGVIAKGVSGRARHVTLLEAGSGMSKGTARRFRGFFASRANELTVRASDASGVVRSVIVGGSEAGADHLLIDRDGARLVDVEALPWQTLVIREDAVATLGDGISILPDGANAIVKNRSGHDLRAAFLKLPTIAAPIYFPRIKDGENVASSSGHTLTGNVDEDAWTAALAARTSPAGSLTLHPLAAELIPECFEHDAPGLRDALGALAAAVPNQVDWLPSDAPVLLAQLDGGEGHTRDAGLRLESDRVVVRILGWGGKP